MQAIIDALGGALALELLALTIKSSTVILLALLVVRLGPRLSAATRFAVVFSALVATLFLPVLSRTLPPWPVFPSVITATQPAPQAAPAVARDNATSPAAVPFPMPAMIVETQNAPGGSGWPGVATWLALLWLIGMLAISLRTVLASRRLVRLKRQAVVVQGPSWSAALQAARSQMGVRRPVELRLHPDSIMPMTFGWRAPVVILPLDAQEWGVARRRDVLLHELAHVARNDFMSEWISAAACVLQWFNPLVWTAKRALLSERERACDDLVLAAGVDPSGYAHCLLETTVAYQAASVPGACMARPSELEARLVAIHDADRPRHSMSVHSRIGIALLCVGILVPLSTLALDKHTDEATLGRVDGSAQVVAPEPAPATSNALTTQTPIQPRVSSDEALDPQSLAEQLFSRYDSDARLFAEQATIDLQARGAGSVEALVAALSSDFPVDRAAAAARLGDFDGPVVVDALIHSMADPSEHVREWAARSLGDIGDPAAQTALVNALADPEPDVVEWSVRSLATINRAGTVDALVQTLAHSNVQVREWSVRALGDIGSPRALDGLIASLQDRDGEVRQWAVRSLIAIGDPRGIDAVSGLENDPNVEVREWSQRAREPAQWPNRWPNTDD